MTASPVSVHYPTATDRLIARVGRALVAWADHHATQSYEHQTAAIDNGHAVEERERAAAARLYLRG